MLLVVIIPPPPWTKIINKTKRIMLVAERIGQHAQQTTNLASNKILRKHRCLSQNLCWFSCRMVATGIQNQNRMHFEYLHRALTVIEMEECQEQRKAGENSGDVVFWCVRCFCVCRRIIFRKPAQPHARLVFFNRMWEKKENKFLSGLAYNCKLEKT